MPLAWKSPGGTVDFEAVVEKFLREESGLGRVGLWVGQHVSVRRRVLEVLDVVVRGLPAIVEKLLAIFRGRCRARTWMRRPCT